MMGKSMIFFLARGLQSHACDTLALPPRLPPRLPQRFSLFSEFQLAKKLFNIHISDTHNCTYFKTCPNITTIHFHVKDKLVNCDCGFNIILSTSKNFCEILFRTYPRKFSPSKISSHTVVS